jgi:hypothetical protein
MPLTYLPPLEYRWALDIAMSLFHSRGLPYLICHIPALKAIIEQQLPKPSAGVLYRNGLWVEPMQDSWHQGLHEFSTKLEAGSNLVLLTSLPIARWLPERRNWAGRPLGVQLLGLIRLKYALQKKGFLHLETFGLHGLTSMRLNYMAHWAEVQGRPEVADRLRFSGRLHYLQQGPLAVMSTVALGLYRMKL